MAEQKQHFSFFNSTAKVAPSTLEPPAEVTMNSARNVESAIVCDKGNVIDLNQHGTEAKPVGASGGGSGQCDGVDVGICCSCGCDCSII